MARSRYTARVSRGTSPRRKFIWARSSVTGSLGADSIGRTNLLSTFETAYGAEIIGATIVRVRGIFVTSSTASGQLLSAAAMVEPNPIGTLAAGEGPTQRPFADWMLYEPFSTTTGDDSEVAARIIDVKSARKIEELNEQFNLYYQTPSGNSAAVAFHFTLSIGLKLP